MKHSGLLIQDIVAKIETARASRPFKYFIVLLVLVLLGAIYNYRVYRNFYTQEAMDDAQLARNIAQGRGYSTLFVRPFSIHLIRERTEQKSGLPGPGQFASYAQIKENHPDIANPPVYPLLLAGVMKVLPFRYAVDETRPFWSIMHPVTAKRMFWRYQPDFLIAMFNEVVFLLVIAVAFIWAHRMFDPWVAWLSAFFLFSNELLWRFSVSGLSTMVLLLIFMLLAGCLTLFEVQVRQPKGKLWSTFALAAAAGALVAAGGLTRYAFAWLIIPTLAFMILFAGPKRVQLCLVAGAVFAVVMAPWIFRNYNLSGAPFGTATYSVLETTALFPEDKLERSLNPDTQVYLRLVGAKLLTNARDILVNQLPTLGGSLITGFFLVGLMVPFRNQALRRLRYFLLMSLGVLILAQALGRTQLSEASPGINSENLLVLFLPLVLIYGTGLFLQLLDQIKLPVPALRGPAIGLFGAVICLPMIFVLLLPRTVPVNYPPYSPKAIQLTSSWMKENELMMSDVPWAVAWYGKRQCVWLTLFATQDPAGTLASESFFAINDFQKPVSALYLTPLTMDTKFVSDWLQASDYSWGNFMLRSFVKNELPASFPLRQTLKGFLPEQVFLTDWVRWQTDE